MFQGYQNDVETLADADASNIEKAIIVAGALFDVTPAGKLRRLLPRGMRFKDVRAWVQTLMEEHRTASRVTYRAFQFSEDIDPASIKVAGAGGKGADIVAKTFDGTDVVRDITKASGNANTFYDRLMAKAVQAKNTIGVGGKHSIFVELTEEALGKDKLDAFLDSARAAEDHYRKEYWRDLRVIILDSAGHQVYP